MSISTSSGSTNTLPFQAVASTDPTPTQAGNEVEAMFMGLSQLVAAADHELGIALYPFLNSAGAGAFGIKLSGTLTDFKTALDQYFANTLNSRLSAADWQAVDAIMGAEAATQALAGILAGADKLSHSTVGEAMLSLREVISKIREIRDTLNLVNDAILLATGPGTVLAPEIVPILLAVSEVLTTVIDALDTIRLILAQAPTSPVAETFEIFSYQPELLELNDQYIRNGHEPDPACILIPYPRNIRGRIDLNNRHAPSLQGLVEANLPPEFAFVVDLLHLDITPDLAVNDVEIKVGLRADTGGESLIRGNWLGDQGLEVKGLAPGDTTISIYPDLAEVNDQCPDNLPFGISCIRLDEVSIRRNVRVYERPVIKSLSQNAAFIGDRITITGECTLWKPGYTDENYQDVFFTGPSDPQYGNGYVYDEDVGDNSYFGYSVIVPDAIPGATWFFIGSAESNHFPFTVNRPWLERVPPSAILGESWEITGRGFSGIPEHNTGIFKEVSTSLEAWADAWGPYSQGHNIHDRLNLTVPLMLSTSTDIEFRTLTLGELVSQQTATLQARKFSPVITHNLAREGLRPSLARDETTGDKAMAWLDMGDSGAQLLVSYLPAGALVWDRPSGVSTSLGGLRSAPPRPAVAVAGGKIWVAWINGNDRVHLASSANGVNWTGHGAIDEASTLCSQVALAAEEDPATHEVHLIVAWTEENSVEGSPGKVQARHSGDGGATWDPVGRISGGRDGADPALNTHNGMVAVAWSESTASEDGKNDRSIFVRISNDSGATFAGWDELSAGQGSVARYPSVAVRTTCTDPVFVASEAGSEASLEEIYFARLNQGGVTVAPHNASGSSLHSQGVTLGVDTDCLPALAWIKQGGNDTDNGIPWTGTLAFLRSFDGGGSFLRSETGSGGYMSVATGSAIRFSHPAIAVGGRALITLAWQEGNLGSRSVRSITTEGEPQVPGNYPAFLVPVRGRERLVLRSYTTQPPTYYEHDMPWSPSNGDVWVSGWQGERLLRLTRGGTGPNRPELSPDGGYLAYTKSFDLFVAEGDGRFPIRLLSMEKDWTMPINPYWSPNGQVFLGVRTVGEGMGGYSVNTDGTSANPAYPWLGMVGLRPWAPGGGEFYPSGWTEWVDCWLGPLSCTLDPAWPSYSYDGGLIVNSRYDVNRADVSRYILYTMLPDGSSDTMVGDDPAGIQGFMPVFTWGGKILYVADEDLTDYGEIDETAKIKMTDRSGGNPQTVYEVGSAKVTWPEVLDDGQSVFVHVRYASGVGAVVLVDIESGQAIRQLTPAAGYSSPASAYTYSQ